MEGGGVGGMVGMVSRRNGGLLATEDSALLY